MPESKRLNFLPRLTAESFLPWILPVALLSLWQLVSSLGWLPPRVLPSPLSVFQAGWRLTVTGELPTHLLESFRRALLGFALGASTSIPPTAFVPWTRGWLRWGVATTCPVSI